MGGIAVAQTVRRNLLLDACAFGGLTAGMPHHLRGDRHVRPPIMNRAWKQIRLRFHPTKVLTQGLQQLLANRHIAVPISLALMDVDHHPWLSMSVTLSFTSSARRMPVA